MTQVLALEVNPFAENTYLVWDDSGDCIIVDPGVFTAGEQQRLAEAVTSRGLHPVRLLNTHAHLDHVFGNAFVYRNWGLLPEIHRAELPLLERYPDICRSYGIPNAEPSPMPTQFLSPYDDVRFGHTVLKVLYTPGHSPASLSFYCAADHFILAGDVLFHEGIGRTDLPGGHFPTLEESIRRELYTLPEDTVVYPGHGPATTVRHEKAHNPFVAES